MPNLYRFAVIGAIGVLVSACAGTELGGVQKMQPTGTAFDQALYAEYVAMALNEYNDAEYEDSDVFALRGADAAKGMKFAPEEVGKRNLSDAKVVEVKEARYRLVRALSAGGGEKAPKPAAKAQVMFECWMQEEEETYGSNYPSKDIDVCRSQFLTAMSEVELALQAKPMTPAPKPAPAPAPAPAALPGPFTVFFDFNSAKLNSMGSDALKQAAGAIKKAEPGHIVVTGHADRSGTDKYNDALSAKRAQAVAKAIMDSGAIAGARIVTKAKGETEPRIATPDGQREPANRRVTIELAK